MNEDCTVKLCDFGLARSVKGMKIGIPLMYEMSGDGVEASERHRDPFRRMKRGDIYQCLVKTKD